MIDMEGIMIGRIVATATAAGAALILGAGQASAAPLAKHSFTFNAMRGISAHGWWSRETKGKIRVSDCVKNTLTGKRGAAVAIWFGDSLTRRYPNGVNVDAINIISYKYGKTVCRTYTMSVLVPLRTQHLWLIPNIISGNSAKEYRSKAKRLF
jgi:hypothetical protein